MKAIRWIAASVIGMMLLTGASVFAAERPAWMDSAESALNRAVQEIGLPENKSDLLAMTDAGYGQIGEQSTEAGIDLLQNITGCSIGMRTLLTVHASVLDPLWFSLYRKDTGKLVFIKWTVGDFDQQVVDASPDKILSREGWKAAASGLMGPKTFSVVSMSLTWAVDPPWALLKAACFHDHFCPGVNAGYIAGEYLKGKMALGPGENYVFVTAPAICPADALQVMFNTTAGKSSGYAMSIDGKALKEYSQGGIRPITVAMCVNRKENACKGKVLGFDWDKAYEVTGVKQDELSPEGGKTDPMFWIARVKMSRELARMPKAEQVGLIAELKSFSGAAALADQISGGDPYATAFKQ